MTPEAVRFGSPRAVEGAIAEGDGSGGERVVRLPERKQVWGITRNRGIDQIGSEQITLSRTDRTGRIE